MHILTLALNYQYFLVMANITNSKAYVFQILVIKIFFVEMKNYQNGAN